MSDEIISRNSNRNGILKEKHIFGLGANELRPALGQFCGICEFPRLSLRIEQ
jgi:hypothetical protein